METLRNISQDPYFIAFVCSVARCLWMLFTFKNKKDSRKTRIKWKTYFIREWDDLLAALVFPHFLLFISEWLYTAILLVVEIENDWEVFYKTEEVQAVVYGLFAVLIYSKLIKKGEKKIDEV